MRCKRNQKVNRKPWSRWNRERSSKLSFPTYRIWTPVRSSNCFLNCKEGICRFILWVRCHGQCVRNGLTNRCQHLFQMHLQASMRSRSRRLRKQTVKCFQSWRQSSKVHWKLHLERGHHWMRFLRSWCMTQASTSTWLRMPKVNALPQKRPLEDDAGKPNPGPQKPYKRIKPGEKPVPQMPEELAGLNKRTEAGKPMCWHFNMSEGCK